MPIQIDADFPGGACDDVVVDGDHVSFDAPSKGCPMPLWFAFRVRGAAGHRVHFAMRNAADFLGAASMGAVQPVMLAGGSDWVRVERQHCGYDPVEGVLRFTAAVTDDEVRFAHCYPYQLADLNAWLEGLTDHPHAAVVELGRSAGGRPVRMLCITNPEVQGVRRLVWCIARSHAGEVPGSFVLEGIADALLSDAMQPLRDEYVYCFAPMLDVDGVEEGSYGKNQPPVDFNRDWSSAPHWPAVRLVQEAIRESAAQHEYVLFLDLHAPTPGGPSYLVPTKLSLSTPRDWAEAWRLGSLLEAASPTSCPLRVGDYPPGALDWEHVYADCVATGANYREHGVTALCVEIAYHRTCDGKLVGPQPWRRLGRAFPGAIDDWLMGRETGAGVEPPVPLLPDWVIPNLPRDVTVSETHEALIVEPTGAGSWLTIETKAGRPLSGGRARATLVVDNQQERPIELDARVYFEDSRQLRVNPHQVFAVAVDPGVHEVAFDLPAPAGAVAWRLALVAAGLEDRLVVREERGQVACRWRTKSAL